MLKDRPEYEVSSLVREGDPVSNRIYWYLFAGINLILLLPIWLSEFLPLVDFPNHLARAYILYHYDDVQWFKNTYHILIEPIPNLAIDLILPPLLKFFDIVTAGKIFLTITILIFTAGCHMLATAIHGQRTWLAFPCFFFSYSVMFLDGFVNYVFGLGMFFIFLALWFSYRTRWTVSRILAVTVVGFLAYVAHLSAYSFMGFSCLAITLYDVYFEKRITRQHLLGTIPLFPPLICFLKFMHGSGKVGEMEWDSFRPKLSRAFYLLFSYDHVFDYSVVMLTFLTILFVAWKARREKIVWPIYAAGLLFWYLFLICPLILFTSWGADMRFVPPAVMLILLSVRINMPRAAGRFALAFLLTLFVGRIAFISWTWNHLDAEIAEQVKLFDKIEMGSTIYPMVFDDEHSRYNKIQKAFRHTICWSTISRKTSVARLFALRGQQPLVFNDPPDLFGANLEIPPERCDWHEIFRRYDYVFCFQAPRRYVEYLKKGCDLIASENSNMIFKIRKKQESHF